MKLFQAARLAAAFLVVTLAMSLTFAFLAGGGGRSGRSAYKTANKDPRSVLVQVALFNASPVGSSSPAHDLLRSAFATTPDGAKPVSHAAFDQTLKLARESAGPEDTWLLPALAAQHGEKASLSIKTAEGARTLDVDVSPTVLDKDIIRAGVTLEIGGKEAPAQIDWSTALTLKDGAVIAIDLTSIDPVTAQPISMLLVMRASIVTKKPG